MSRVGNNPINIPDGVNVQINPSELVVSGKLGTLTQSFDTISITQNDNVLNVTRSKDNNEYKSKWMFWKLFTFFQHPKMQSARTQIACLPKLFTYFSVMCGNQRGTTPGENPNTFT
mgnify:CR=1 FL=1